jgi:hypothetical protein
MPLEALLVAIVGWLMLIKPLNRGPEWDASLAKAVGLWEHAQEMGIIAKIEAGWRKSWAGRRSHKEFQLVLHELRSHARAHTRTAWREAQQVIG